MTIEAAQVAALNENAQRHDERLRMDPDALLGRRQTPRRIYSVTTIKHPLIGVSGKKRSGKDTFAQRLIERWGYTRVAFADPMRDAALALDPIIDGEPERHYGYGYGGEAVAEYDVNLRRLSDVVDDLGWEGAKAHPEVRRTLQRLGTEMGRNVFGVNFWVDMGLRRAAEVGGPVVITDVRFRNEADAVKEVGGLLLRIDRPGLESTDTHPSEVELDDYPFPFRILNDGTIDDLHEHADFFAEGFATDTTRAA